MGPFLDMLSPHSKSSEPIGDIQIESIDGGKHVNGGKSEGTRLNWEMTEDRVNIGF